MGMMRVNTILLECRLNKMMPENGALNALTTVTAQSMVANLLMAITTYNTYWTGGLLTEELGRSVLDSTHSMGRERRALYWKMQEGGEWCLGCVDLAPLPLTLVLWSFLKRIDTSSLSVLLLSSFSMVLWVTSLETNGEQEKEWERQIMWLKMNFGP